MKKIIKKGHKMKVNNFIKNLIFSSNAKGRVQKLN